MMAWIWETTSPPNIVIPATIQAQMIKMITMASEPRFHPCHNHGEAKQSKNIVMHEALRLIFLTTLSREHAATKPAGPGMNSSAE